MDYIFSKTFIIECLVSGTFLYKFPLSSFIFFSVITASHLYSKYSNIKSKRISNEYMNAALYDKRDKFTVEKIQIPNFSANELLVQVKAGAINPVDYKIRTCDIPFLRWIMEHTVGRDFSGIVVEIGTNVKKFKIGDEVYGNAAGGSLQEYTRVNENQIALKPSNINHCEAASIALAGATSLQALLHWGNLNNKKVLIIGGSGGCGNLGIQIAKYYNSKVYAVCSNKNINYVKSLGADIIIDYTKKDFLDDLKNEKFDLIYDTVTSMEDENQEIIYRKFLKSDGKYVAINARASDFFRGFLYFFFGLKFERKDYHVTLLNWNTADLDKLTRMVEENKLRSKINVYELNKKNVKSAFEELQSRRTVGKIAFEI